jgi:hypothetical protein
MIRTLTTAASFTVLGLLLLSSCDTQPATGPEETEPPRIQLIIVSPAEDAELSDLADVQFVAEAYVDGVGPLPGDSLRWGLDGGHVGYGSSVALRLAPGSYLVEAWARYDGREAKVSRVIEVYSRVGHVLWSSGVGRHERSALSLGVDGTLYVQDDEAFELVWLGGDGVEVRRAALPEYPGEHPVTVLPDGSVLVTTMRGVAKLSPGGAVEWEYLTTQLEGTYHAHVHGGVAVASDGTIYFGSEHQEGFLIALWPDGRERWVTETRDSANTSYRYVAAPVLIGDTLVAIVNRYVSRIVGVDARSGDVRWRQAAVFGTAVWQSSPALTPEGDLIVRLRDQLVRLAPTGELVWTAQTYGLNGQASVAPTIDGERVYLPTRMGGVYVYRLDGSYVGRYGPDGVISGSVTVGRNGVLYVLGGGALHSYTPDGSLRYSTELNHQDPTWYAPTPPVLAASGTVYVRTSGDGVVAVGDTVGPTTTAAWPTLGGSFQRLGRR